MTRFVSCSERSVGKAVTARMGATMQLYSPVYHLCLACIWNPLMHVAGLFGMHKGNI